MSIIVFKVTRTIPSLCIFLFFFIFFLRKDFESTKTRHKQKTTNKTKIIAFWCSFYAQNLFLKKKKKKKTGLRFS